MSQTLSTRLKELLQAREMSVATFAEMCDLPLETVRNIYYGRSEDPKVSTVLKMSRVLNLSVNCLLGECMHSKEERMLIQHFRHCGRHGKSVMLLAAKYEALAAKEQREATEVHMIPCLFARGRIQDGLVYDACEVEEIKTTVAQAYVGVRLATNEFVPTYCKGDILLFENRFPEHGEYAMFYKGKRAFLRKFLEEDGQYRLQCVHRTKEDVVLKKMDQVEYIGTCIDVVRV